VPTLNGCQHVLSNKFWIYASFIIQDFLISFFFFTGATSLCVGLGLLYGFVTTWRTREYTSSDPYPFKYLAWVALTWAPAPASIAVLVIGARKLPLHDKAIVFMRLHLINILAYATERLSPPTAIADYNCKYPLYAGDRYTLLISVKAFFNCFLLWTGRSAHRRLHGWEPQTVRLASSSQGVTDTRFRISRLRRVFPWSRLSSLTTTHLLHGLSDIILQEDFTKLKHFLYLLRIFPCCVDMNVGIKRKILLLSGIKPWPSSLQLATLLPELSRLNIILPKH
jgi:hypothetical protein